MNENTQFAIEHYCQSELNDFTNSSIYSEISLLTEKMDLRLLVTTEKNPHEKDDMIFLYITITNKLGEVLNVFDDGFMTYQTELTKVDRKNRVKFFSWRDKDFIETLVWIRDNLKNPEGITNLIIKE